jgi:cytochrome c553
MRNWKLLIPAAVLASGFLLCTTASFGTPAYMKKENLKSCTACHTSISPAPTKDAPKLNALGQCYLKNNFSLAKCDVPADQKKQ